MASQTIPVPGTVKRAPDGLIEVNRSTGGNDQKDDDRAQLIVNRQKRSYYWQKDNFYPQFEQVYKSYKCERDPVAKDDKPNEADPTQTSIGMPDTWMVVRRTVARITAQIPNLRFNAKDPMISELVARSLMYQWDKSKTQRIQKIHATQAALFGISIRPWFWASEDYKRFRRVNPMKPQLDPADTDQIIATYGDELKKMAAQQGYSVEQALEDPSVRPIIMANLLAEHSRGGMLPVKYEYTGYEGPKCDFLLMADCFPEPNFRSLQSSNWFIVERRRNLQWMEKFVERYPDFRRGFQALMDKYPDGTVWNYQSNEVAGLRRQMESAIGRTNSANQQYAEAKTKEWTIQEQWVPGYESTLSMVGEKSVFLGEMPAPYMLDGKIPFTELVLIEELLSGVGDSTARVMRGLQLLHDRQTNTRVDLTHDILRPLYETDDPELYENAESKLARFSGGRLVLVQRRGSFGVVGEQAAMAAVANGLQDDQAISRLLQMVSGETNMSMAANVDPSQSRTATGARIMAYNQDVLTKDQVDSFNNSLNADAEMMFLLNRSELSSAIEFQAGQYRRLYTEGEDMIREEWVKAEPEMFQIDGEITAEVGSTLADDDEAKVTKATNLFHAATQFPNLLNPKKATQDFIIAMGKGKELQQWAPDPQPPPPEKEVNTSLTIAAKWESLTPQEKQAIMNRAHVQIQLVPPTDPQLQPPQPPPDVGPPPGAGAPGPDGGGGPPPGPPSGPSGGGPAPESAPAGPSGPEPLIAASALAAARGRSPLGGAHGLPQ
ncbi:MAG TPA: hypothetical protein VNL17_14475 [Verrucomicrobiae bacterium]|nr:hypothetical protein [Verrucomicrobiae bacterium]